MKTVHTMLRLLSIGLFLLLKPNTIDGQAADSIRIKNHDSGKEQPNVDGYSSIMFSGFVFHNKEKQSVWYIPNIFEQFPINTIEGFVINPNARFTKQFEDGQFYSIAPNLRYGFGNKRLHAIISARYFYNPIYDPRRNALLSLAGGRSIEQISEVSNLNAFNNILYTYAYEENYFKAYERTFLELGHTFYPFRNTLLSTTFSWNKRRALNNMVKYIEEEAFTSNNPENLELDNTAFEPNSAFIVQTELRWQIGQSFIKQKGELVPKGNYPAIILKYTNALNAVFGSNISFQKISLQIEDSYKVGKGYGEGLIKIGDFIKKDNLIFVDFNHFNGKQTLFGDYAKDQFQLLDYYRYSTANFFVQGHYEHHFGPIIDNGKSVIQPVFGINYLRTESGGNYIEFGLGIDKVFGRWRFDFYNSWSDESDTRSGIRIEVDFN